MSVTNRLILFSPTFQSASLRSRHASARWFRVPPNNTQAQILDRAAPPSLKLNTRQVMSASMISRNSSDAGAMSAAKELRSKSCVGMCGKDTPKVPESEIQEMLKAVPLWKLSEDGRLISKEFVARNFMAALKFLNDAGAVAEAEGHHPDFHLTNYRNVQIDLTTHSINALSLPDFILAAKLDDVEVEYSPKWLRENPEFDQSGASGSDSKQK